MIIIIIAMSVELQKVLISVNSRPPGAKTRITVKFQVRIHSNLKFHLQLSNPVPPEPAQLHTLVSPKHALLHAGIYILPRVLYLYLSIVFTCTFAKVKQLRSAVSITTLTRLCWKSLREDTANPTYSRFIR